MIMSEEAKVRLVDKATAIVSSGHKNQVKRRERFCKNWEFDSDNSDVERDQLLMSPIPTNRRTHRTH